MTGVSDQRLFDAVLNSWDRNNLIVLNLLRAVPDSAMQARAVEGSPTVAQLFSHVHYVRLAFVAEDAPEYERPLPEEWEAAADRERMGTMLNESAAAVREAVAGRLTADRAMDLHYDHPVLMLQHLIWHEGYHHGQIKLALKAAGHALDDREIGRGTWGVWMRKTVIRT